MLSQSLTPDDLSLFRDPHVIVTFRDPVSIAVRTSLSDYQEPMPALRTAVEHQAALVAFVDRLQCPTLLLSYEKSLVLAWDFIDAILRVLRLAVEPARCVKGWSASSSPTGRAISARHGVVTKGSSTA